MRGGERLLFRVDALLRSKCLFIVAVMIGLASCASAPSKEERLMSEAVGFSIAEAGKFFASCARGGLDCDRWAESFFVLMGPGMNALLSSPNYRSKLPDQVVGELCNGLNHFLSAPLAKIENKRVAEMALVYRPFAVELYGLLDEEAKRRDLRYAGCDLPISGDGA